VDNAGELSIITLILKLLLNNIDDKMVKSTKNKQVYLIYLSAQKSIILATSFLNPIETLSRQLLRFQNGDIKCLKIW